MAVLDKINSPSDIRGLSAAELTELCREVREFLVNSVSQTGGHLASNLGVVELTMAIHMIYNTERDRLVFDVGHQSYVHKLLTGRRDGFSSLRQLGGMSGFPKPSESIHDAFIAGHASDSLSVALGMARARTLSGRDYSVVALIGDGALTGGLAYEALSDIGDSGEQLVVILNDNGMSITKNVGGVSRYLSRQRLKPSYHAFKKRYRRVMDVIPGGKYIYRVTHAIKAVIKNTILSGGMFEEMGLHYVGPLDGHDIKQVADALKWAKESKVPTFVHVITRKGKGYSWSESTPEKYHGVSPFNPVSGQLQPSGKTFSSVFGDELVQIAGADPRVCAITAAMASGTGLQHFAGRFPARFFDVGIAEGHAASMSAGLASQGAVPVFAVYSTFLQRTYDMLLHDVGISRLHVVFAIDRAGLVGGDGETHQGTFDVAFLSTVPNMKIFCPASYRELCAMLRHAIDVEDGPVAVRYAKGAEGAYKCGDASPHSIVREGADFTLVTYGTTINTAIDAASRLEKDGISLEIVKLGRICPIDYTPIVESVQKTGRIMILEESIQNGSVGERIAAELQGRGVYPSCIIQRNVGNAFAPCGSHEELCKMYGLDAESVSAEIAGAVKNG